MLTKQQKPNFPHVDGEHLKAAPRALPGRRCFPQQLLDVLHLVALDQLFRVLGRRDSKHINRMCATMYVCAEQEVTRSVRR